MEIGIREILEAVGAILMGLLTIVWRNLNGDIKAAKEIAKAAVPTEQFLRYQESTDVARKEFRESLVKLFERTESHERRDDEAFKTVTRDFTAGMNALRENITASGNTLRDQMWQGQREILKELNGKADK